jgi:hypothetical protein
MLLVKALVIRLIHPSLFEKSIYLDKTIEINVN